MFHPPFIFFRFHVRFFAVDRLGFLEEIRGIWISVRRTEDGVERIYLSLTLGHHYDNAAIHHAICG